MIGSNHLFTFVGIVCTVSLANAVQMPIKPTLVFKKDATTFPVNSIEIDNLGTYPTLVEFIKTATDVCSVGRWVFYPEPSYKFNGQPGYVIGLNEKERCVKLTPGEISNLSTMKSYRHIGPKTDLSVTSITLYSLSCFGGDALTYSDTTMPFKDIALKMPVVGSYVITAPTDTVVADDQALKLRTVVRLFTATDASTTGPGKTCLALVNPSLTDGTKVAKIHFQQTLMVNDVFGSLEFVEYKAGIQFANGDCDNAMYTYEQLPLQIK